MSIQAVGWALDQDLPARPKLVLVAVANHANHEDGYCWLKAETIAREAACTPRSVYRFVGALARNGYLRKAPRRGGDGKQRANDYWILFDRPDAEWDWGASPDADIDAEVDADLNERAAPNENEILSGDDAAIAADEPHEPRSYGEGDQPTDSGDLRRPVDKHAVSSGPCDSRVSRYKDEPSKPNPSEAKDARAGAFGRFRPRSYAPPPPQPMGSVIADREAKLIFVYEGTPAYEAWALVEARRARLNRWHLTTSRMVDGKSRAGWWFPSLFPPEAPNATDPPKAADN